MMEPTDAQHVLAEARHQAKVERTATGRATGPQAAGGINTVAVIDGVVVRYGRVGITALSDGFIPRET